MGKTCVRAISAAAAIAVMLSLSASVRAADNGAAKVAEELDKRTKPEESASGAKRGLSDSQVRVMSTFALSLLPDEVPGPGGKSTKLDKSHPSIFLIPIDDARTIIRASTRSAYAEACNLPELERANYVTLMRGEENRKVWSREQMMFINALHMFSVSYFTGNVKISEQEDAGAGQNNAGAAKPAPGAATADAPGTVQTVTPKKLQCAPGQKEKVTQAINNYVQSAKMAPAAKPSTGAAEPGPSEKPSVTGSNN